MKFKSLFAAVLMAGVAASAVCAAPASIEPQRLSEHIKVLSSDAFEGRGPATPAEQKTIDYISRQFAAYGLKPGGPNGSWFQDVTLLRTQNDGPARAAFKSGAWTRDLKQGPEIVIGTQQPVDHISL